MSKQIKIELYQHDNFLCGRCLEFPDELRGSGKITADSDSGFAIFSSGRPDAYAYCLYLRGTARAFDDDWFYLQCETSKKATTIKTTIERLIKDWNEEQNEILDKAEKEYLCAVIKPFRESVKTIVKYRQGYGSCERLVVEYKDGYWGLDNFSLPTFQAGTAYKGMELDKMYSCKELGL